LKLFFCSFAVTKTALYLSTQSGHGFVLKISMLDIFYWYVYACKWRKEWSLLDIPVFRIKSYRGKVNDEKANPSKGGGAKPRV